MKVVVRGKAISITSAMKRKRREKQQTIIANIQRLEQLHKLGGGGEILYAKLMAEQ